MKIGLSLRHALVAALAAAVLAGVALPGIIARAQADSRWGEFQRGGVLRAGIDPNWAPFSFYGPAGWQGVDADIAGEVARRMGLALTSEPVGFDSMYDALAQGRVDVIVSAVVPDGLRMADVLYTTSYFDAGLRLATSGGCAVSLVACLKNKRVAVALGTDADRAARFWERRATGMRRVTAADDVAALALLRSGNAEAAIVSGLDAWGRLPNDTVSVQPRVYVFGVRRDNPRLAQAIDDELDAMRRDGTLAAILTRWLTAEGR